jgi:hypothetical protein
MGTQKTVKDYETSSTPGPNFTPQQNTIKQTGQGQHAQRLKRDIACLYGYSSKPKECNVVGDIAEFFFSPIVAVIKASKGPK